MVDLPSDLEAYRRTAIFDAASVPAGLLRRHTTKAGVWARVHVLEGELLFRRLEPVAEETRLGPGDEIFVEPGSPHEVAPQGAVRFFVEFLRRRSETA